MFFAFVFALLTIYFYVNEKLIWCYLFGALGVFFITITAFNAEILLPLNKLWMRFGLFLGSIVSPLVLGAIFFFLFTPIAFLLRFKGRDELNLKIRNKSSYWAPRIDLVAAESFKKQY